ncbi:hypothetical protein [Flavonifractor sp. An306]|uniref:hypothetical protein n=1 Tax=Flavonifractor sp. An306 TaxID=1965629 RepID=UPI00174865C0|nr:hypothetical protein [Flavonifractor sp. An306]
MIEFIEKEPYYDDSMFTGRCNMYPTFMVKDGKEYFMFNRRAPDDSWRLQENEERKKFLASKGGAYFKIFGYYDDPMAMIDEIRERKHTFTNPDDLFADCRGHDGCGEGFVDFHGNRREVSAAFYYRIYDEALLEKIRTAVVELLDGGSPTR